MDDLKNGALYIGTIPSSMDNNRCSVALEDDGSVTFYIYAPNANKVEVAGMGGYFSSERIQLKPDMQGGFSANIKDFHWAMHYYFWYVDDVCITNPHAAISYGCFAAINTFEVPEGTVSKDVHWFLMQSDSFYSKPQREEYFQDSGYYKYHEAYHLLKFANERKILEHAYAKYQLLRKNQMWGRPRRL